MDHGLRDKIIQLSADVSALAKWKTEVGKPSVERLHDVEDELIQAQAKEVEYRGIIEELRSDLSVFHFRIREEAQSHSNMSIDLELVRSMSASLSMQNSELQHDMDDKEMSVHKLEQLCNSLNAHNVSLQKAHATMATLRAKALKRCQTMADTELKHEHTIAQFKQQLATQDHELYCAQQTCHSLALQLRELSMDTNRTLDNMIAEESAPVDDKIGIDIGDRRHLLSIPVGARMCRHNSCGDIKLRLPQPVQNDGEGEGVGVGVGAGAGTVNDNGLGMAIEKATVEKSSQTTRRSSSLPTNTTPIGHMDVDLDNSHTLAFATTERFCSSAYRGRRNSSVVLHSPQFHAWDSDRLQMMSGAPDADIVGGGGGAPIRFQFQFEDQKEFECSPEAGAAIKQPQKEDEDEDETGGVVVVVGIEAQAGTGAEDDQEKEEEEEDAGAEEEEKYAGLTAPASPSASVVSTLESKFSKSMTNNHSHSHSHHGNHHFSRDSFLISEHELEIKRLNRKLDKYKDKVGRKNTDIAFLKNQLRDINMLCQLCSASLNARAPVSDAGVDQETLGVCDSLWLAQTRKYEPKRQHTYYDKNSRSWAESRSHSANTTNGACLQQ